MQRAFLPKVLREKKVKRLAIDLCRNHVFDFKEKQKRWPLTDEAFDAIASCLIDVLRKRFTSVKVSKICKFVAHVFCDFVNKKG